MNDETPFDTVEPDHPVAQVRADYLFSMVPEWVLYADISANAVRLYAVLNRYAQGKGECFPSRRLLAEHLRASKDTVDRVLEELTRLGAVEVRKRKNSRGDWASNLYLVRSVPPEVAAPMPLPSRTGAHRVAAPVPTEREPIEREKQKKGTRSRKPASPAALKGERIAKAWWDRQEVKPAGARAWHSLKASCTAVVERGWKDDDILRALDKIAAVPSVAQLDRELRSPRAETWAERKAREEREEADRIRDRREAERLATEERLRRMEEDRKNAVPMPEELRARARALRGERAS